MMTDIFSKLPNLHNILNRTANCLRTLLRILLKGLPELSPFKHGFYIKIVFPSDEKVSALTLNHDLVLFTLTHNHLLLHI